MILRTNILNGKIWDISPFLYNMMWGLKDN